MGCVLYELCALASPFKSVLQEENDLVHVVKRITSGEFPAISSRLPYSKQLRELISAMLKVDPNTRPADATVCTLTEVSCLA